MNFIVKSTKRNKLFSSIISILSVNLRKLFTSKHIIKDYNKGVLREN